MKNSAAVFAITLLSFAGSVFAGMQFDIAEGDVVNVKLGSGLVNPKVGGVEVNLNGTTIGYSVGNDAIWAGCYLMDVQGIATNYKSFCMNVQKDPAFTYVAHTASAANTDIEAMWGTYYDDVVNDFIKAAAFQLAIWEIIHENGSYDITSGNFYFQALYTSSPNNNGATFEGLVGLANSYLNSSNWTTSANLVMLTAGAYQPFIAEVPEPATMVLLGLGGLLLRKRK